MFKIKIIGALVLIFAGNLVYCSPEETLKEILGIYIPNQTVKHYGFSPTETKQVLVVEETRILEYNFDCNGEGCSEIGDAPNQYILKKKITKDTFEFQDGITKKKEIYFINSPKKDRLIFAPREDNKISGEPLIGLIWIKVPPDKYLLFKKFIEGRKK